ncbi:hypothetical protein KUTeg_023250 [Tegillarca granosa]|uniref:NWD1/2-like winged helix-turn-helix domain-containing protein n=1 Tax=Tegillarca granosa TaxID=220873 RepID=A0ABQ9E6Q2_TEGGR|nr:hypothetical protein KUTeg_023250 [Tegillarca granosa]
MYFQAADENKKRSTKVLPPLEQEATPPKQTPRARGSPDEAAADAHWNLKFKKVSLDVDKRVINHLRKKLNRRLERRLMDAESDASSYTENRFNRQQQSPPKQEVILGERYGSYILPNTVPEDEFTAIAEKAGRYRDKEMAKINDKLSEIEKTKTDRDPNKQQQKDDTDKEGRIRKTSVSSNNEEANKENQNARKRPEGTKKENEMVKELKVKEQSLPDPQLLKDWYRLDENTVPPLYRLQNISSIYKDYSRSDVKRREAAENSWKETSAKIRKMFDDFVEDARQHLDDDSLHDFFDFHPVEKRLAVEPTKRINAYRDEQIPEKLTELFSAQFILPYEVHWINGGISSVHRPHQFYLDRMCKQVFDMFKRLQANSVENADQAKDSRTKLYMEVSSHVKFAQETKNPSVLLRIITLTTPSRNVRSLLRGLCLQLCDIFRDDYQTVPTDYKGIVNYLHQRLNQATKDNPLFILLDGVDQLSDEYESRKMAWLPKQLPRNVKIIVTTSSDKKESLSWTSFQEIDQIKLPETVKKIVTLKYGKLETKHGEPLVRRALGYISACRNGASNCEMEDLLSLDESVMDNIMSIYRPPKRRIPSIFWFRLRDDLLPYTKEVTTGNIKTLQWAHTQYYEAAEERYLKARDKAPSYHKAIGEYFLGVWEKKPKPYSGNDTGVSRFVSAQPFYFEPEDSPKDGSDRIYNLRKVNELPYQLLNSQQTNLYKTETVCNFEWILAKLCGTSLQDLVEEYQIGLQVDVGDKDLKIISDTIQLSAKALNTDPRQLAAQLIGRLHKMIENGMPKTRDDPHRHPMLFNLFKQAHASSLPTLVPSVACLTESGGILFDLLSGHTEPITAVGLTSEGMRAITASRDNTMKVWDIRSGKVVKTLENTGTNIQTIRLANGNAYAVTVENHIIRVWHIRHGECILRIDRFLDNPVICIANDGKFLVALFDGINLMRTWDIGQSELPMISETKIEDKSVFKDQSVLIAPYANEAKVLHAFRGANFATVQNAQTGKIRHILKCKDDSSSVACLAMTRDYYVVCCRQQYMQLHEIHILELFDIEKGKHLRSVRGCMHDRISELYINLIGSHAIAICTSEKTATSDIAIWNIETEDHKHLAQHAGMSTIGACADFKYCLTAQTEDKTLCIWNLSGKVNQTMPKLKKTLGIEEIIPLKTNPRYCVTRQIGNGEIAIWNLINKRYSAVPVSVERGLSSPSDVIVIKDTRVIVLSERGFSSADYRPVFQKLVIYDLKTKEFVRKISNCYITPCPAHEYMVIDENHMLDGKDDQKHNPQSKNGEMKKWKLKEENKKISEKKRTMA